MKKLATLGIAASLLLLFSCSTYTVQMGRENIHFPAAGTPEETKYSVLLAREEAVKEEARRIEEQKKAEERARAEALRVNEYPEDLSSLTFPFYYNPQKSTALKENESLTELKVIFIPLGEKTLKEDEVKGAIATLKSVDFTIIGFTGSLENQVMASKAIGLDAVTGEGGTLAFQGVSLKEADADSVILQITSDKALSLDMKDFKPALPTTDNVEEVLEEVEKLELANVDFLVESLSRNMGERSILFLSSFAPASSDWTDWTDFDYRTDENFIFSDILESLKWIDTYSATHYSVETTPGVTRRQENIAERLDFLFVKGILPISSLTVPLEKTDVIAVVADYLLP
ncbi:MAG: hypothetical protein KBS81_09090 [Spirochaetales bacterium]|nr:hypothetical protein [Candidatus Physcosoma equi]